MEQNRVIMGLKTLKIAIVGHTNTGKTSLIRTITRERNFGEVRDEASTTIDVAEIKRATQELTFTYVDTPGIEDAMGVLDLLEERYPSRSRLEESTNLLKFAQDQAVEAIFDQEVKVIKQLFVADLICYVIDCRLPFLPKFDDELTLIEKTHKPILPILNFIQGEHLTDWKQHLKAHGIHHYLEFDTIMPPQKRRFYEQIAIMFPEYYAEIMAYNDLEELADQQRLDQAMQIVANFYLNLMTLQLKEKQNAAAEKVMKRLNQMIEKLEKRAFEALLSLYQFNRDDIAYFQLAVEGSQYEQDLFTSDNLIDFSMQFGKGAGIGAGLFAGVDALAGFTTLGAATATGAILGGLTASFKHYGTSLLDHLNNLETYCINDTAIDLLVSRMLYVIGLLNGRSHAELNPIYLQEIKNSDKRALNHFITENRYLRAYPQYFEKEGPMINSKRQKLLSELSKKLKELYLKSIKERSSHNTADRN